METLHVSEVFLPVFIPKTSSEVELMETRGLELGEPQQEDLKLLRKLN